MLKVSFSILVFVLFISLNEVQSKVVNRIHLSIWGIIQQENITSIPFNDLLDSTINEKYDIPSSGKIDSTKRVKKILRLRRENSTAITINPEGIYLPPGAIYPFYVVPHPVVPKSVLPFHNKFSETVTAGNSILTDSITRGTLGNSILTDSITRGTLGNSILTDTVTCGTLSQSTIEGGINVNKPQLEKILIDYYIDDKNGDTVYSSRFVINVMNDGKDEGFIISFRKYNYDSNPWIMFETFGSGDCIEGKNRIIITFTDNTFIDTKGSSKYNCNNISLLKVDSEDIESLQIKNIDKVKVYTVSGSVERSFSKIQSEDFRNTIKDLINVN